MYENNLLLAIDLHDDLFYGLSTDIYAWCSVEDTVSITGENIPDISLWILVM